MSRSDDRRETERVINESRVLHREYSWSQDGDYVRDQMADLSKDGFSFESDSPYVPGSMLQVRLLIFGWQRFRGGFLTGSLRSHTDPLVAIAKVVHCSDGQDRGRRIGCTFESVDPDDARALAAYLDHLKSKVA